MRALIAGLAALLLSGCWIGDAFYPETEARPAVEPGSYRVSNLRGEAPNDRMQVSIRPSGMTRLANDRDREITLIGFAPLDSEGNDFVAWIDSRDEGTGTAFYGLLRRLGDGDYLLVFPNCDETVAIAEAAGATASDPAEGARACRFASRQSLEAALRQLRPDPAHLTDAMIRLRRIADEHG